MGLAGSTAIPETNRPGLAAESSSTRVQVTAAAGSASTFFEMKTLSSGRGGPLRGSVGCCPRDSCHRRASAIAPGNIGQRRRAEPLPVTACVVERAEPFIAYRLRFGDRPRAEAGGLRPVDSQAGAGEQRLADNRIADHGRVELAAGVAKRVTRPDPLRDIAIVEVNVGRVPGEVVETELGYGNVEAGLAAVADHRILPLVGVPASLPGAVILRPALQHVDVMRAHGQALELQCREALVEALELRRDAR